MSTNEQTIIVWFRSDLRIEDNPALFEATREGRIIPVFIWSPEEEDMSPGAATRWWLHHSLKSLAENLNKIGAEVNLMEDEIGVSPGQACVFYSKDKFGDKVLGGGWITKTVNKYLST